ncbi:MAG: protein-L-isoaspartate(D-aspartate) O-methyltransferase [Planctomycetaceae bacterium]|nr:protein-L-isoaspartate(D-aspartate) O-methyltransferase [Planctomycetaceae bacterium]
MDREIRSVTHFRITDTSARPRRWLAGLGLSVGLIGLALSSPVAAQTPNFTELRRAMVEKEIIAAGIKDPRVINAIRDTQRHEFVPFRERTHAYYDMALPIGNGQTISPPYIVAFMTEQLEPKETDKVLEIGTGSGYQAAVLSPLVKEVYSIEIVEPLGTNAAKVLKRLKYANVFTKIGDGYKGWEEHAPFDKVIVTCSPENVPQPLIDQLKEGGRMIIPIGERYQQSLTLFRKVDGKLEKDVLRPTLFVPMTGTAESQRKVKPDPLNPTLINGSYEQSAEEDGVQVPVAWHYVRQAKVVTDPLSPLGEHHVLFSNTQPGRGSQMLQAFAIDGRKVAELEVSLRIKLTDVRPGQLLTQLPVCALVFYDENQNTIGERGMGPWRGTTEWQLEKTTIKVPTRSVQAIIRIGLFGAVGDLAVDDVRVSATEKR